MSLKEVCFVFRDDIVLAFNGYLIRFVQHAHVIEKAEFPVLAALKREAGGIGLHALLSKLFPKASPDTLLALQKAVRFILAHGDVDEGKKPPVTDRKPLDGTETQVS